MDESTMMKKEWNYPIATFVACCLVLLVNLLTAVVNWRAMWEREALLTRLIPMEQRLSSLEAQREQDMQQHKQLQYRSPEVRTQE